MEVSGPLCAPAIVLLVKVPLSTDRLWSCMDPHASLDT